MKLTTSSILLSSVRRRRPSLFFSLNAPVPIAVLTYDWVLTFSDEVRTMWTRGVTIAKILFFVNRFAVVILCTSTVSTDFVTGMSVAVSMNLIAYIKSHKALQGYVRTSCELQNILCIFIVYRCSNILATLMGSSLVHDILVCGKRTGIVFYLFVGILCSCSVPGCSCVCHRRSHVGTRIRGSRHECLAHLFLHCNPPFPLLQRPSAQHHLGLTCSTTGCNQWLFPCHRPFRAADRVSTYRKRCITSTFWPMLISKYLILVS